MALVIVLAVIDLAATLYKDITTPPVLLDSGELLNIFSIFLLVLIGVELVETLKVYILQKDIHAEIIILVAIIALARKIITLDLKEVSSGSLLGIAAIEISLSVAYFVIRQSRSNKNA